MDPLPELAALCREQSVWFHVDGAYGAPVAALLPDAPAELRAIADADSVAIDPHKWLYAPMEAGCALVRDAEALHSTFRHHPPYYRFDGDRSDPPVNFHEWGIQNSRGFRALKVWLGIRQAGREGIVRSIAEDIALTKKLHAAAAAHPEVEALTCELSISTFRYVPADLRARTGGGTGRRLSRFAERRRPRSVPGRRRGVRLQRGHRRPVRPPRLHRELPDDRGRRRRGPRASGAGGEGPGRQAPAGRLEGQPGLTGRKYGPARATGRGPRALSL